MMIRLNDSLCTIPILLYRKLLFHRMINQSLVADKFQLSVFSLFYIFRLSYQLDKRQWKRTSSNPLTKQSYLSTSPTNFFGERTFSCSSEPLRNFLGPGLADRDKELLFPRCSPSFLAASWSSAVVDDLTAFCCSVSNGVSSRQYGLPFASSSSQTSKQPLH